MKFGSLFAGIGGIDLGLERAGMTCSWQVEIDDYASKVLQKHWPNVARFRDVRDCGTHNLEQVDLIAGGFPCQDVSLAGKRAGLEGERSTLWSEFIRIVREIGPRWILAENVPGLLSSDDGRFFSKILRDLAQSGYDAEWNIIPASALGAIHRRNRIYILAYTSGLRWNAGRSEQSLQRAWKFGTTSTAKAGTDDRILWDKPAERNWSINTGIHGMANGIPNRVDRLRCLGNAVVPQVAEWIGRRIMQVEQLSF
jgi:DNA (cytosine-5)-methyltransferase 1